jgi:hypothetical protein
MLSICAFGELGRWRLVLELNELGRSMLAVDPFLADAYVPRRPVRHALGRRCVRAHAVHPRWPIAFRLG